jgi:hypothetical protein
MSQSDAKIALLIDADNAPAAKIDLILSELAKYGMVNIRRAYGNWKSTSLQSWENVLHEYAIRPIQQFDYTKGKNATDMALVIEAMDLLYTQKLDAFCVVSGEITNNSLKIHYQNLLAKKNWITLSENKLLAFLTTLRGIPPSSSKELISACSLSLSNILTPTETETAFNIFWKAKLFEVASPDGHTGLKKVLIFQDSPHVLHKIDTALLTRLLVACVETGTPIDTQEIKPLLYGYYNQNLLADVIKKLSDELTLKD